MMIYSAWFAALALGAFVSWCLAAFGFGLRESGRLIAATLTPGASAGVYLFSEYWVKRVATTEPGWDVIFALMSIIAGTCTLVITLPVYVVAETQLGGRAS